jgi:putative transposase
MARGRMVGPAPYDDRPGAAGPARGRVATQAQGQSMHSDQGSQFTSREWQLFLGQHNLEASMSRRGNCHDNAVAESFFHLLKRERIRRCTYPTREAARQDVFEYIEMFYNPKRKHTNNGMLSPVDFEARQQKLNEAGV